MSIKYIFVTGGVVSSLGKGLTAASIAKLLESKGLKIAMIKLDPYLNVDPGTMNPLQHGEIYVTDDGAETDLDLGHYYRYTNSPLSKYSNATSGQIYDAVIRQERKGIYLGRTVQVIPHITNEIKRRILQCAEQQKNLDVIFVEIGGTVGDIESLPFLEAIRQFRHERQNDCMNIHLTYVPYLKAAGEVKTKPTQHSVQTLRQIGIIPDMILCRCEKPLSTDIKAKISLFCDVKKEAVIDEPDVENSIYEVPLDLHRQKIDEMICEKLALKGGPADITAWKKLVNIIINPKDTVKIAIVGKYLDHQDAYKSIFEALHHGAIAFGAKLELYKFDSEKITDAQEAKKALKECNGCLVPGGFGARGWNGKILAAQFCRENGLPYFGICLGMQVLLSEFAVNVLELQGASSTEVDPETKHPIIALLQEQKNVKNIGGTMRLGAYPCRLVEKSKAFKAYKEKLISERHRHRYEFNNNYKQAMEEKGILFSGILEKGCLCEIAEIKDHPWMVGVQFHPEFKSKPDAAHPLFKAFIQAALKERAK